MAEHEWARLQSLFERAIALPEDERDAFVSHACKDDSELAERVLALLEADAQETRHDEPLLQRVVASDEELIGSTIGQWRLIDRIGSGGMGSIFLAERADSSFEQQVALKVIKKGMDSENVVHRFEQERQLLARLEHPNIARLLDGGVTDDGRPCFAMEYIDGSPITQYCDNASLSIKSRLILFIQVCEAVHAAHRNLIVHRDLKPSNILVTSQGDVKLLDFGIAKLLVEQDNDELTMTGMALHTPVYAAPEQLSRGPVTTAIDIYALGALLYELLAGKRHYDVARQTGSGIRESTTSHASRPSVAIKTDLSDNTALTDEALEATRGVRVDRLVKMLAGDLDMICMKALHPDPERRYSSANQLSLDIQRHLEGLPVVARPDSAFYRTAKFMQRHRLGVVATFAIVTLFGLMIAHYTNELALERDNALEEQRKANEVVAFVTGLFTVSKPNQSLGEELTARDLLDAGAQRIRTELAEQPEVQFSMQRVLGEVYFSLSALESSRDLLQDTLTEQSALLGPRHLDVAETQIALGMTLQALGTTDTAFELYESAYATRIALLEKDSTEVLDAIAVRAFLQETMGNYAEAEALFRETLAMAQRIQPGDSIRTAKAMDELGGLLRIRDSSAEAEPLLRDALAMQQRIFGRDHPDSDNTKRQLAGLLRDSERYEESQKLYLEVLESRTKMLGPLHMEVAHTWNSYSQLLQSMNDLDGAVDANTEFIRIMEATFDSPHPSMAAAYNNRGFLMRDQGDLDGALENLKLALATLDALDTPAEHPNRSFPSIGIGDVYFRQQRYTEAEDILRQALSIRRAAFGETHRLVAQAKHYLGKTLVGSGNYDEAERFLLEAYQQYAQSRGDSKTRLTADALVELYEKTGETEKAEQYRLASGNGDEQT